MRSSSVEAAQVSSAEAPGPEFSPGRTPTSGEWSSWLAEVSGMASRMTCDDEVAMELSQEALISLFRSRRPIWSVAAWARRVMDHLLTRIEIRQRAERSRSRALSPDISTRDAMRPETAILVSEVLERIPELHRRPLLLSAAGLSHVEMAARLRCAVHQVGPRLARAHRAARRLLSRSGDERRFFPGPE